MKANEAHEIIKKVWNEIFCDDDPFIRRVETFEDGSIRAVVEDTICAIIDNGENYTVLSDGCYLCTVNKQSFEIVLTNILYY